MAKILLVEDDQFLNSILRSQLEEKKYQVVAVFDGQQALDVVAKVKPDLILLDLILPNKDGFEVAKEIRASTRKTIQRIPILILSNLGQTEDIKKAEDLGIHDYLIKAHFSPHEILSQIEEVLKRAQTK